MDNDIFGVSLKTPQTSQGGDDDIFGVNMSSAQIPQNMNEPAPVASETPQPEQFGVLDSLKNSFLGGIVRGVRDIPDGGAQLVTRTLEGLPETLGLGHTPQGQQFQQFMQGQRENVENINQAAEQDYRENWRQGDVPSLDGGRIAGNIIGSLPLAAAVPGASAASMGGKTAYGVAAGLTGAATQPVLNNGDFWQEKQNQALIGAGAGALGPHVANVVGKGASKIVGGVKRAITPTVSRTKAVSELTEALNQKGVNFSKLAKETQDALADQAQKSLNVGGDLNIDELARKADFDFLNIQPTKGQLSHNPVQVRFEKNTAGINDAGEDLALRFNQQNKQLIENVNQVRPAGGVDSYQAGRQGIDVLTDVDKARSAAVGAAYKEAREDVGAQTLLDGKRWLSEFKNTIDELDVDMSELPSGVRTRINKIESGETPFTIDRAEKVIKSINKRLKNATSSEEYALNSVKKTVQNEIDRFGEGAGGLFTKAKATASDRFAKIEASPAMQQLVKGVITPDDFIKKHVIGAKAVPLRALRNDIQSANPQVWQEMKGQVVDFLKSKALNQSDDEFGKFSASAYNKALNNIGNAKLKVLFDPAELRQLRAVGRVSSSIANQPIGANVNNSNTAAAAMNLLGVGSKVPLLSLAADPLRKAAVERGVNKSLSPGFTAPQQVPGLSPEAISRLNLPFSVAGYPLIKPMLETDVKR